MFPKNVFTKRLSSLKNRAARFLFKKSLDKLKLRCYNDLKLKKSCDEDGLKFKL